LKTEVLLVVSVNQILERDRWSHGNLGGATMIAR
jgi:hypothetical protein